MTIPASARPAPTAPSTARTATPAGPPPAGGAAPPSSGGSGLFARVAAAVRAAHGARVPL